MESFSSQLKDMNDRCMFCGGPLDTGTQFDFCSDSCEKKMDDLCNEREKKKLCVMCGDKLVQSDFEREGKFKPRCRVCFDRFIRTVELAQEARDKIPREEHGKRTRY